MAKYGKLLRLICVGRMRDRAFDARIQEYMTRIGAYGKFETTVLPDSDVEGEGRNILREIEKDRGAATVVLTEEGREFTTAEFSAFLGRTDRKILFVIGGPFGLAAEVKARADLLWALSKMTFTHEMARLIFVEQLYRGLNLLNGGSYHH